MSGRARPVEQDLLLDDGLLLPETPVLEIGGTRLGGPAVTPWRADWRQAADRAVGLPGELPVGTYPQVAVRLGRGRAGTQADLATAWSRLAVGGRLAVEGANDLGAAAWVRRLTEWLAAEPVACSARAHRRAAAFVRHDGAGPPPPPEQRVPADLTANAPFLVVPPGVFSGDGLDDGTAALLGALAETTAARQVLDLGCGAGHLGLWCARHWNSDVVLADADARAVAGAAANAARLGLPARCVWWDDREAPPASAVDLVLVNPPAHAGAAVDLTAAQALLARGTEALAPGGRMLVVANRRLPYERPLAQLGQLTVAERDGYKILTLVKPDHA